MAATVHIGEQILPGIKKLSYGTIIRDTHGARQQGQWPHFYQFVPPETLVI